jgi:WD40 repeat protein
MMGETPLASFTGHTDWVNSVAFSPDGQHIISGSSDQTICIWNAMSGKTAAGPCTGHTGSVRSVAFSLNGQHIVLGSDDQTICYAQTLCIVVSSYPLSMLLTG